MSYIQRDQLLFLTEQMVHADLNSSWHEFAMLCDPGTTASAYGDLLQKERSFQIYYRHKLTYEGSLIWKASESLEKPEDTYLQVRYNKIRRGSTENSLVNDYVFSIRLADWLSERGTSLSFGSLYDPDELNDYNKKRIDVILQKWGFSKELVIPFEAPDAGLIEQLIQRVISTSILVEACRKQASANVSVTG
ncbi:hypothetical protein ACFO4L_04265 [Bacillus daqingensis]|uniref:Uncharacterized protein n=1 Tax=Bacillus daqingensis TaxID=872396 RepID=A0ABV9NW71_9BACI